MDDLRFVNIVGSGAFSRELDLTYLSDTLSDIAEYEPEIYPGMYLRLYDEDGPLITIYRTGKFIIVGSDSIEQLHSIKQETTAVVGDAIGRPLNIEWFETQNFVGKGDVGRELNLNAIAIDLGLAQTEYDPEQFPGVVYRPGSSEGVGLIFRSGKVVVTGAASKAGAKRTYNELIGKIERLFE